MKTLVISDKGKLIKKELLSLNSDADNKKGHKVEDLLNVQVEKFYWKDATPEELEKDIIPAYSNFAF